MFIKTLKAKILDYIPIFTQIKNRLSIEMINQITMLITIPIVANALGLNSFAIASQGMIILQLIMLVSAWGIDGYSIEELNRKKDTKFHYLFINSVLIIRFIIIFALCILFYVLINLTIFNDLHEFFWFIIFAIISTALLPLWYYQAIGKSEILFCPTILGRSIFVIITIYFVKDEGSIEWVFISQGISSSIISFFGILTLYKKGYNFFIPNIKQILSHFYKSTSHFFVVIVNNHFNSIWATAILFLGNPTSIAFFNLANQFLKAGMGISELLARVIRQSTYNLKLNNFKNFIFFISCLYLIFGIILIYFIEYLLAIFLTQDYLKELMIFQIIIITWFLNAIFKLLNYNILFKVTDIKKANKTSIFIGLTHILSLSVWLIYAPQYNSLSVVLFMTFACFIQIMIIIFFIYFLNNKNTYKHID